MSGLTEGSDFVREVLKARTGIALDADKSYLLDSRLLPVARAHGIPTVAQLLKYLQRRDDGSVLDEVLDALCTNETSWLRDEEPFQVIVEEVLPVLLQAPRGTDGLTFWSAGCSTGQEPYSLAMALAGPMSSTGRPYRIVATDVSATALSRARTGLYRQSEIGRGLPLPLLAGHFHREEAGWRISQEVRDRVRFERSNLVADPPPVTRVDLVMLRNVLIYFDLPTRQRVLEKVHRVLDPGGVLLLGAAETTLGISAEWHRVTFGRTTLNIAELPSRQAAGSWAAGNSDSVLRAGRDPSATESVPVRQSTTSGR